MISASGFAAAAAAILSIAFLVMRPGEEHDPRAWMGDGLTILHPRNAVTAYAPFEWESDGSLPPGGEYRITVSDATGPTPAQDALLRHRTTDTRWTPSPTDLERLPDRIWVTVGIFANGARQGGDATFAER